ncbi:MAG: type IX secretion system outer membrane channel protein PorV [Bacteroidales bacterium]|nr:type IX secretion system outer membrane channel protein PorV [Bacteroidales bacterium]
MNIRRFIHTTLATTALCVSVNSFAQESDYNPIHSSVQMLNIGPEARGTAMGDAGVATSPDVNSQHWNPAKYAFMESKAGASLSVTPWLRNIIGDINLFYAAGYYQLKPRNTVSASVRYFSLGDLIFTDDEGYEEGTYKPNEFSIDAAYSLKLSNEFSGAVALRFIHSDLGFQMDDDGYSAGNAFAADIAFYYKKGLKLAGNEADLMAGINISNIGTKITYDDGVTNEYLPANLRLGVGFAYKLDQYNKIAATVDLNKLLVPTPNYKNLTSGEDDMYEARMKYYDKSVVGAIFSSFGDAPRGGKEELEEIDISGGVEYTYNDLLSARFGYHHNPENKGNLKYASAGLGIKYKLMSVDASYVFTVGDANNNSALNNTIRITLGFDLGSLIK